MANIPAIYIDPNGKVYRKVGISEDQIPEFSYNEVGLLLYKYRNNQEFHGITIDSDGNMQVDGLQMDINDDGTINTSYSWELVRDVGVTETMQKNIDLLRSHNKMIRMKVSLLDNNYIEIENVTGKIVGYPSYDIDSESDIRRTCSLTLSVPIKEQVHLDFEKTWNKRMVELSAELYDFENERYVSYPLGRMLMTSGESVFNATTQEIKLNLVDLMASMTEERGSQIGETYLLQAGDDPKHLIEGDPEHGIKGIVAENTPFSRTSVCEFEDTIPYDLYSNSGDYAIDVLHLIFDLFPYYEFFYDKYGVFTIQQIPTKISDPVDIGKEILDDIIISETKDVDFSEVKNTTEIWGRSLSGDYVATDCTTTGSRYDVTIDETFTELVVGEKYTVQPLTTSVTGQSMQIQNTAECDIYIVDGAEINYTPIPAGAMKAGVAYVLRYFERDIELGGEGEDPQVQGMFILEGELQVRCIVQEITEMPSGAVQEQYKLIHNCNNVLWKVNPESPFACTINETTGEIEGEIRQVLRDGEYDNIYTTQLAYERASYENWLRCKNQDTVSVEMILVPWMDVNDKIQYTSPVTGELTTWLVKGISYDFSNWTMTVNAKKFYPYYPFWEDGEEQNQGNQSQEESQGE